MNTVLRLDWFQLNTHTALRISCRMQDEYGGAAVFNAGLVMFRGQSYFRDNGLYEKDGLYSSNPPGGAILNVGDIEVY